MFHKIDDCHWVRNVAGVKSLEGHSRLVGQRISRGHRIKRLKHQMATYTLLTVVPMLIGFALTMTAALAVTSVDANFMLDPTTKAPAPAVSSGAVFEGKLTLRNEIEGYIKKKFGKDGELALKVAKCESGLRSDAINLNKGHSLDAGLFQINLKYHPDVTLACASDAKCNTDAAYAIYLKQGFNPWKASKGCWGK